MPANLDRAASITPAEHHRLLPPALAAAAIAVRRRLTGIALALRSPAPRLIVMASLALLVSWPAAARAPEAGNFDYYALALSWSPTFCASQAGQNDNQQCGRGRRYAFVVHGLWPQWQRGWPQFCPTGKSNWLDEKVLSSMLDIMPSRRLIINEWKKHGTCSGLDQEHYFALARTMFAKIKIPPRYNLPEQPIEVSPADVVADFVKENPGLDASMLSLQCGNRRDNARLSELRVCFDRDGAFISCGSNERRQCRAQNLVMPPVR